MFLLLLPLLALGSHFTWVDITDAISAPRASRRNLLELGLGGLGDAQPFVRRRPSPTVSIFQLHHLAFLTQSGSTAHPSDMAFSHTALGIDVGSVVQLPLCTGLIRSFRLSHSGILSEGLRAKWPHIGSYIGICEEDNRITADITLSPAGVRAQIWTDEHLCYVDPYSQNRSDVYVSYSYGDRLENSDIRLANMFPPKHVEQAMGRDEVQKRKLTQFFVPNPKPDKTFNFRLGVATTAEYNQWAISFGGKESTLTTTFTRALGIWGRILGLTMTLIPNQNKLMTFSVQELENNNNNNDGLLNSGSRFFAKKIKLSEIDVGHFLHVGDEGGVGGPGPCGDFKVGGATAGINPIGDSFDVDFVAHELSHQFGLDHTWTGIEGGCTSDQFATSFDPASIAGMELGSGSTLLTYAGICGDDNIVLNSKPYFHVFSLHQFATFLSTSLPAGCGQQTPDPNPPPTVATFGSCVIPKQTAFALQGTAADPNDAELELTWEQVDPSFKQVPLSQENKEGPLFISLEPSVDGGLRLLPTEATVLAAATDGTTLDRADPLQRTSSIARDLHFALTAHDRYFGPGGLGQDGVLGAWATAVSTVEVSEAGPLVILGPIPAEAVRAGKFTVNWALRGLTSLDPLATSKFDVFAALASSCVPGPCAWALLSANHEVAQGGLGSADVSVAAPGVYRFKVQSDEPGLPAGTRCFFYAVSQEITLLPPLPQELLTNVTDLAVPTGSFVRLEFSGPIELTTGLLPAIVPAVTPVFEVFDNDLFVFCDACTSIALPANFVVGFNQTLTIAVTTLGPDLVAPAISSFSPANGQVDFAGAAIVLTYNEDVKLFASPFSELTINNLNSLVVECAFSRTGGELVVSGRQLTVDLRFCPLTAATNYSVTFGSDLVSDLSQNAHAGLVNAQYTFTTAPDVIPPTFSVEPFQNQESVFEGTDIALFFDEAVLIGAGFVVVSSVDNSAPDVVVNVEGRSAELFDDTVLVCFLSEFLAARTTYSVTIPQGVVTDLGGNPSPALQYTFTTGDSFAPELLSVTASLDFPFLTVRLTYDEPVIPTRGTYTIVDADGTTVFNVGAVDATQVSFQDNVVTVAPLEGFSKLAPGTHEFSMRISPNAVRDLGNIGSVGISSDSFKFSIAVQNAYGAGIGIGIPIGMVMVLCCVLCGCLIRRRAGKKATTSVSAQPAQGIPLQGVAVNPVAETV